MANTIKNEVWLNWILRKCALLLVVFAIIQLLYSDRSVSDYIDFATSIVASIVIVIMDQVVGILIRVSDVLGIDEPIPEKNNDQLFDR